MAALKSLPLIDGEEVEKYLEFEPLFNALEAAFVNFSKGPEGGIIQPVRGVVRIEEHNGYVPLNINLKQFSAVANPSGVLCLKQCS